MKSLFFISNQPFSGKSSLLLGIGLLLKEKGYKIGYMKPLGTLPVRVGNITIDEDAHYIAKLFDIKNDLKDISPLMLTNDMYVTCLETCKPDAKYISTIKSSFQKISAGKDVVLLEGAGTIDTGICLGIDSKKICSSLPAKAVVVLRYTDEVVDQVLYYSDFFKDCFGGIIINLIPDYKFERLQNLIVPYLKDKNISVLGIITQNKFLSSVSVKEMAKHLDGKILNAYDKIDELVESFMIGAMGHEPSLRYFKTKANKAVITGGDRADIQLAALETNTKCLILTGNFQPSTIVSARAEELGVPMVLVKYDTFTTVERLNEILGHTGFHELKKVDKIVKITKEFVDLNGIISIIKS
ncbi:MAG: phosphotransacetylase family protein [Actinobacteria bacterium]|nr:phosphotransacetylase family protein [Actinomycetota bacterium]MBM3712054.1 phosphotransacetylase family protein [Actinomycetota bacterium]